MGIARTALAAAALTLAGCGKSMNVQTDHDRQVSFDDLDSYVWVESTREHEDQGRLGFDSEIMARRIERMVRTELARLGYARDESASSKPDFAISYRMLATEEVERIGRGVGHGGHGGHHGHRGHGFGHAAHGYGTSGATHDVVRCVLMLDVRDPETNRLIWRGWVRWQMDEEPSPEEVTRQLERAVEEILSEFPPGRVASLRGAPS